MKLELNALSSSYTDDDEMNLNHLLEAFGSVVSLEEIASAYSQTSRNLDATVEILCSKQGDTIGSSSLSSQDYIESQVSITSGCLPDIFAGTGHITRLKPNRSSASMGAVSGMVGREYIAPRPQPNGSCENYKPVKLHMSNFPVPEIWNEKEVSQSTSSGESMNRDLEEFLFKMLGSGFQFDMNVINDVVGQCGYDAQMSIDKLLDLSAATLGKSDDVISMAAENIVENNLDPKSVPHNGKSPVSNEYKRDDIVVHKRDTKNDDIEREILMSLFNVPGKIEEKHGLAHPVRRDARRLPYGKIVTKPLEDTIIEDFTFITRQPVNNRKILSNDEDNASDYEDLRKAVLEYWMTMKKYYKAALDAFTKSDSIKAKEFLEKGHFFMKKAREIDEKSAQKLFGNSDDEQEQLSLNVHFLDPKEARKHLRLNLISLSGYPSIPYLKVVVGTDGEDTKKQRRKRLITQLLEGEGIQWTEEGNGWILSIRVDQIDPKKLSFANK